MKYSRLLLLCVITLIISACAKDNTIQVDAAQAKSILSGVAITMPPAVDDLTTITPPPIDIICMTDSPHCSCRGVNSCNVLIAVCAEVGFEIECISQSGEGEPDICSCGEL